MPFNNLLQGLFGQQQQKLKPQQPAPYQDPMPNGDESKAAKYKQFIEDLRKQGKSDRDITILLRQLQTMEAYEGMKTRQWKDSGKMI
jgi:hypothetical protein